MPLIAFLHTHVTSWILLLVLFAVAYIGYKNGNKSGKIAHMAFRLMLLIAFGTGLYLYLQLNGGGTFYHVKITVGLLTLIFGEMTLVKVKKKKRQTDYLAGLSSWHSLRFSSAMHCLMDNLSSTALFNKTFPLRTPKWDFFVCAQIIRGK